MAVARGVERDSVARLSCACGPHAVGAAVSACVLKILRLFSLDTVPQINQKTRADPSRDRCRLYLVSLSRHLVGHVTNLHNRPARPRLFTQPGRRGQSTPHTRHTARDAGRRTHAHTPRLTHTRPSCAWRRVQLARGPSASPVCARQVTTRSRREEMCRDAEGASGQPPRHGNTNHRLGAQVTARRQRPFLRRRPRIFRPETVFMRLRKGAANGSQRVARGAEGRRGEGEGRGRGASLT